MTAPDTATAAGDTRCFVCRLWNCSRCRGCTCTHDHGLARWPVPEPVETASKSTREETR